MKVGLAVGVTVCLLRRRKVAEKVENEQGATEADMGDFERISLE